MDCQQEEDGTEVAAAEVEIENVRVVVRVRPMDKIELNVGSENVVTVDKVNRSVTVHKPNASPGEPPKVYYFDNVFADDSAQVRTNSKTCVGVEYLLSLSKSQSLP